MGKKKQQTLLDEFSVPSYDEWLALVEKQLKGAPFDKRLITKTSEGISIQPIYMKNKGFDKGNSIPGSFPFTRHVDAIGKLKDGWEVSQEFVYPETDMFNQSVLYDLNRGLTSVSFSLDYPSGLGQDPDKDSNGDTGQGGLSLASRADLVTAFKKIDFSSISLQANPRQAYLAFYCLLIDFLDSRKISRDTLKGNMIADPFAQLAENGGLTCPLDKAIDEVAACVAWSSENTPSFKSLGIDLSVYERAGASAIQELAVALGAGVEYMRLLQDRGIDLETTAGNMVFHFAMGSDFFLNIAKVRAARRLWSTVIKTCGCSEQVQRMRIHARTSSYNKTLFDPHVNLLRATTEAYSAVLSGCDSICVAPFDSISGLPDEMSRRISRNIQIILKEECHGHRIIDPGGGAWFLEDLTNNLAESAWSEFQEMEKQGGLSQILLQGNLQQQVAEVAASKKAEVGKRKQVIVGTNMYSIQGEIPHAGLKFDYRAFQEKRNTEMFQYKSSRNIAADGPVPNLSDEFTPTQMMETVLNLAKQEATIGQLSEALGHSTESCFTTRSLDKNRLASDYEELRQNADIFKAKTGDWPQVFLVNMGPLKQHKARADFSTGFVEPGGFQVIGNEGFESVQSAVDATIAAKAKIAVICSTDDTYPTLVPEIAKKVKASRPDMTLVLAGYPKDHVESFKAAGIDEFIHLKASNLDLLRLFHQKAGVQP